MSRTVGLQTILVLLCVQAFCAEPVELHVAVSGNHGGSGTAEAPFASLFQARTAIRRLKADGKLDRGATVCIHPGTYHLTAAFELTAEDGGSEGARIVYSGFGDGETRLVGGVAIDGFSPFRGSILQANVRELGLVGDAETVAVEGIHGSASKLGVRFSGNVPATELFFAGKRMPLARWPNAIPDHKREGQWALVPNVTEQTKMQFHFPNHRLKNWSRPEEAQVHIFPWYNFMDCYVGVKSVDAEKCIVHLADPTVYDIQPGRRFYVRNVFEELDAPGEWYLDRDKGVLFFWPPAPFSEGTVLASRVEPLVHLNHVSHVTIRGLTFECSRGSGVIVDGGSHNRIVGCTIRNTKREGISISGTDNAAIDNDIHDTGLHGIRLAGGDRKSLIPGRNLAENNHIQRPSRVIKTYTPGVQVTGVGNRVRHNLIHDCPHMALGLGGNDHVIEFNEVHHAMLITSHGGAFYTGRDWTYRGNAIRFNAFHDINGYGFERIDAEKGVFQYASPTKLHGCYALHFDDQVSGFEVYGNLFYRIGIEAIRMGGGRDFRVENNVFVDAGPPVHIDARGIKSQKVSRTKGTIYKRLVAMPYKQAPWSERYPELVDVLEDHPGWPRDNKVIRNIMVFNDVLYDFKLICPETTEVDYNVLWRRCEEIDVSGTLIGKKGGGQMPFAKWQELGYDAHSVVADPKFVDADADDFRLQKDSPALKVGFRPIPIEKIGLYKSESRASWPPPAATDKMEEREVETYPIPAFAPRQVAD
jgi:parallel beta-helix repeat protein